MSNNKQSSVEWLDNELASLNFDYLTGQIDNKEFNERHKSIIEQAKAMHKEEMFEYIKQMYCIGHRSLEFHRLEFEKYYNETFNTKELES